MKMSVDILAMIYLHSLFSVRHISDDVNFLGYGIDINASLLRLDISQKDDIGYYIPLEFCRVRKVI